MFTRIRAFFGALFWLPVAWYNIGNKSARRVYDDFTEIASTLDEHGRAPRVMVFGEAADRHDVIRAWALDHGWTPILQRGMGAAAISAVVHPDAIGRLTHIEWVHAVGPTNVGDPGAGPAIVGDKTILWLRFGRGIRRMHILGTHLTASIDRKELPNHKKRVAHARLHISRLWALAKGRVGATLILGDFNTTWGNAIINPLRKLGFVNIKTDGPTHDSNRFIDLAMFRWMYPNKALGRLRAAVTVTKVEAITVDLSSDHDVVIVRKV